MSAFLNCRVHLSSKNAIAELLQASGEAGFCTFKTPMAPSLSSLFFRFKLSIVHLQEGVHYVFHAESHKPADLGDCLRLSRC